MCPKRDAQTRLDELLSRAYETGEVCIITFDAHRGVAGKDYPPAITAHIGDHYGMVSLDEVEIDGFLLALEDAIEEVFDGMPDEGEEGDDDG